MPLFAGPDYSQVSQVLSGPIVWYKRDGLGSPYYPCRYIDGPGNVSDVEILSLNAGAHKRHLLENHGDRMTN